MTYIEAYPKTLRIFLNFYRAIVLARIAGYKLKKLANNCKDFKSLVDLAFSFEYKHPLLHACVNIKPAQIKEEITKLICFLAKLKPMFVCEIGTASGGTLFLLTRVSCPNATIISIDLPGGKFGGGYPIWKASLYKSFAQGSQRIYLIRADSHNPKILELVSTILGRERKLDLLFIDGDHTYEGVKKDFEMYSLLVRNGGVIIFHDIVPGPWKDVGGVPRFWSEIKHDYEYCEIVKDWSQGGYGIGIIYV